VTNDEMRELIREAAYMRGIHLSDGPDDLYAFDLRLYRAIESFCKQDSETTDKKEMLL